MLSTNQRSSGGKVLFCVRFYKEAASFNILRPLNDFICTSPTQATRSSPPTSAMPRILDPHNCALLFNGNTDTSIHAEMSPASIPAVVAPLCNEQVQNEVTLLVQTPCNLLLGRSLGAFQVSQQQPLRLHHSQIVTAVLNEGHEQKQARNQSHKIELIWSHDENKQPNRVLFDYLHKCFDQCEIFVISILHNNLFRSFSMVIKHSKADFFSPLVF